jgi:DNA-binding Xre family transcriptional regulator
MTFSGNLRKLRVDRFLAQRELARQAGLHPVTPTRLGSGSTALSSRTVRSLADALGLKPGDLMAPDEVAELCRAPRVPGAIDEERTGDA